MKRILIVIVLLSGYIAAPYSREDATLDNVLRNITEQLSIFPQEKIYLHTDKPNYINCENIFFRAFLLDAFSNKQDTLSRYVYVELINPAGSVVQRVKILSDENHLFYGVIPLQEDLQQGLYIIRAYTQYMNNQGKDSFFSKQIRIGDPANPLLIKDEKIDVKDFDITFYPEGGHLIVGQASEIAFKALNSDGTPLDIEGEIINSEGNKVTEFKTVHEGMGSFFLNPLPDEHYQAVCRYNDSVRQFDLPQAQSHAIALKSVIRDNKLLVSTNRTESFSLSDLYLLIHSRGSIVYAEAWDSDKNFIVFDPTVFPSGINHILLLTKDQQVVSERLVFLLNDDHGDASFQVEKDTYHKREQVRFSVQLNDKELRPLKGNFSISVTGDKEVVPDSTIGILSYILLASELKGQIRDPEYYFQRENKDAEIAADLLMRTHGWTRYALPDIIRGKLTYPNIPFETSQKLSGVVKSGLLSKPAKDARVSLLSLDYNFWDFTETDESGHYAFRNFDLPDNTQYVIQALNSKGRNGRSMELYIDEDTFPGLQTSWNKLLIEENKSDSLFFNYMEKAYQQYLFEPGSRIIDLPEIEIKGIRRSPDKSRSIYYSDPDFSISDETIKLSGATDIKTLLYRVPGVWVSGNTINIRGMNSTGGGAPLVLIDGIPLLSGGDANQASLDYLNMINVNDIERLDVIKDGAKLTIYGSRGMHGVIEIHTKRKESTSFIPSDNIKSVIPLGYQLPVEFYSPKYDTGESFNNPKPDLRTTIYWKPDVATDEEGKVGLDFYTADDPGTYSVIIEGVSEDGRLIHRYARSVIKTE